MTSIPGSQNLGELLERLRSARPVILIHDVGMVPFFQWVRSQFMVKQLRLQLV
jgi:hypothetical protein